MTATRYRPTVSGADQLPAVVRCQIERRAHCWYGLAVITDPETRKLRTAGPCWFLVDYSARVERTELP